jgi:hypothetical protein
MGGARAEQATASWRLIPLMKMPFPITSASSFEPFSWRQRFAADCIILQTIVRQARLPGERGNVVSFILPRTCSIIGRRMSRRRKPAPICGRCSMRRIAPRLIACSG